MEKNNKLNDMTLYLNTTKCYWPKCRRKKCRLLSELGLHDSARLRSECGQSAAVSAVGLHS